MLHVEILHEATLALGDSHVVPMNIRASQAETDWLLELLTEFTGMLRENVSFKVACFYEQKPTDIGLLLKKVVSRELISVVSILMRPQGNFTYEEGRYMAILVHETSASLEQRAQLIGNFPRACDHFALNKFPDMESPEWMVLVRCLISMTQGISIPLNLRNFTLRSSHRYEKADQADRTIYST